MNTSTQFLMIGDLSPDAVGRADFKRLLQEEQAHTREAYKDGSIRQIWLQTPGPGAVAILEAGSLEDARRLASSFPLAQAGLLKVNVIALAPYGGFAGA